LPAARLAALLIALTTALAFSGCGGANDSDNSSATATAPTPSATAATPGLDEAAYVRRAEAICRRSVAKTQALGRRLPEIVSSAPSPQQGITNGVVGPGIVILGEEAAALRKLGPPPASPALETYLGLFDPILELARQRLQAGIAEDPERARQLELMIADLGNEQSGASKRFGLRACSIEFNTALGGSG
jgi:hypothetical protein